MPSWLFRLIWRVRGKRLVRLHLVDTDASIEGIRLGKWNGDYVLTKAKWIEGEGRTAVLDGVLEVPVTRVVMCQVLN